MFYCDICATLHNWPINKYKTINRCEVCDAIGDCSLSITRSNRRGVSIYDFDTLEDVVEYFMSKGIPLTDVNVGGFSPHEPVFSWKT